MKLNASDKWFFFSIPVYAVVGIADICYKWFDPAYVTMAWILYLCIGVLVFKLWRCI